jgi:hypothetical protein
MALCHGSGWQSACNQVRLDCASFDEFIRLCNRPAAEQTLHVFFTHV